MRISNTLGFLLPLIFFQWLAGHAQKAEADMFSTGGPLPSATSTRSFAPEAEIRRPFRGFEVSFDSNDDDDRKSGWRPASCSPLGGPGDPPLGASSRGTGGEDEAWCLDTLKASSPSGFTDDDLFDSGLAPNDDSYRGSGFDRGHLAMKLLVERLGQDASLLHPHAAECDSAAPRISIGAFGWTWNTLPEPGLKSTAGFGLSGGRYSTRAGLSPGSERRTKRQVAVPDAVFKIVLRNKTGEEQRQTEPRHQSASEILAFLYPQLDRAYFRAREDYRHERFSHDGGT